jgi:hypothetical protein
MGTQKQSVVDYLLGEQPIVEACSAIADTFAGRVRVEWDATAPVTPSNCLFSLTTQAGWAGSGLSGVVHQSEWAEEARPIGQGAAVSVLAGTARAGDHHCGGKPDRAQSLRCIPGRFL